MRNRAAVSDEGMRANAAVTEDDSVDVNTA
jgi:hypothetical protein